MGRPEAERQTAFRTSGDLHIRQDALQRKDARARGFDVHRALTCMRLRCAREHGLSPPGEAFSASTDAADVLEAALHHHCETMRAGRGGRYGGGSDYSGTYRNAGSSGSFVKVRQTDIVPARTNKRILSRIIKNSSRTAVWSNTGGQPGGDLETIAASSVNRTVEPGSGSGWIRVSKTGKAFVRPFWVHQEKILLLTCLSNTFHFR